jgi:multicomponent Na+:H+ antiporter subunit E
LIVNKLANKNIEESHNSKGKSIPARSRPKKNISSFLLTFLIMTAIWILLSGKFDTFHLSLGIISCAIVAYISGDLLFESPQIMRLPGTWLRFIQYIPWLFYQVFMANLHVLYLTFHPRMHDLINPKIIIFKSKLYSDISLVTFANSITLTPGTITVYVSGDGEFHVHAIDDQSAQGLPGEMEARVAKAFGEE